jgi:hypothetical protein
VLEDDERLRLGEKSAGAAQHPELRALDVDLDDIRHVDHVVEPVVAVRRARRAGRRGRAAGSSYRGP